MRIATLDGDFIFNVARFISTLSLPLKANNSSSDIKCSSFVFIFLRRRSERVLELIRINFAYSISRGVLFRK